MDLHLFLLRLMHASPGAWLLARLCLAIAVGLLLSRLIDRRHSSPLGLGLVLLAAAVCTFVGYQRQTVRAGQLETARSAPVRLAYGTSGAPAIQVFTAPGCGPCRDLEARLQAFIGAGYAVEYIPVSMRGEEDWEALAAAMCSVDPRTAFERVYALAGAPPAGPDCHSRVRENEAVLQALSGREVFPTVVMPDGLLRIGAPSDRELRDYLRAAAPLPTSGGTAS